LGKNWAIANGLLGSLNLKQWWVKKMRKEKDKAINGVNFKVTQLGFEDGVELLTALGNIVGPALANKDFNSDNPTAILGQILAKADARQIKGIIQKLAQSTRIEREPGKWPILEPEVDLAGNYDLTFKWLGFALEVNYGDFLGEAGLLSAIIGTPEMAKRAM
jgi:hypothetical protein